MKTTLIIFLLACLIVPLTGTYCWLHYEKRVVRKAVKKQLIEGIDKDELVLLKFSHEDIKTRLRWKHSREFEYNSQMYDIVETETKGDSVYYWCWWDHEETMLNQQLIKLLALAWGKSQQNKEHQKRLVHLFKSLYYEKPEMWQALNIPTTRMTIKDYNKADYTSIYSPPPVPPPQMS